MRIAEETQVSDETPVNRQQQRRRRGRHAARRPRPHPGGLVRSSAVMALGTVASRVTGLVRLVLQGAALSSGLVASTYNTANTVPTSISVLLVGGALNSVLVPQLVRARAEHADGGRAHEQRLITLAAAYSISYAIGLLVTAVWLRRRLAGRLDGKRLTRTYGKLTVAAAAAGAAGWAAAHACGAAGSVALWGPVLELVAGGGVMLVLFLALARVLRIGELRILPGLR
ncbi:peptidoglycan biosynthesis protein MviN/MurJ (putative lipid II flippase) [Kitasatospora sp. GAS1066B]